jgi:hypothetical protein
MDTFKNHTRSLTSPPEHAVAILPQDGADLAVVTRAIYVGAGGDVAVRMLDGTTVTLTNVPNGTLMPLRVSRVLATGTTASAILGFW